MLDVCQVHTFALAYGKRKFATLVYAAAPADW